MTQKLPNTDKGWQTRLQNQLSTPPPSREWHAIGRGLTVLREAGGRIIFQARLRYPGDTNARRITLGDFPAMSVADARVRLAELRSEIKNGGDPVAERQRAADAIHLVSELGDRYLAVREREVRPNTFKNEKIAVSAFCAELGTRQIDAVKPVEITRLVRGYAARIQRERGTSGIAASRMLSIVRRMFDRATGEGWTEGDINPAAKVPKPVKDKARERVLFDGCLIIDEMDPQRNELGPVWREIQTGRGLKPEMRAAISLCLVMGLREEEAASLQWQAIQLDLEQPTLFLSQSKTDAGRRVLPLPRQIVGMLLELKSTAKPDAVYMFPSAKKGRIAKYYNPHSLYLALIKIYRRLKISGATMHDTRRTMITGVSELGFEGIAGRIAGHSKKDITGRVYDRSRRLAAMALALQQWADHLDAVARPDVPIKIAPPLLALPMPEVPRSHG